MIQVEIDNINIHGCFSVLKGERIENQDGYRHFADPECRAFCPGQLDELREFAPELSDKAAEIWTPEVIAAWREKVAEAEANRPPEEAAARMVE